MPLDYFWVMTKRMKLSPGTFTSEKLFEMIENDDREGLKAAFALKGFDVNMVNCKDETALHKAVMADKFEIVEILTGHSEIDVNAQNDFFTTPLMIAAERGNWRLVELLLRKGASPILKDGFQHSAYRHATERDDCEKFMLKFEHKECYLDELFKALIWSSRFKALKALTEKCAAAKKYPKGPNIVNRAFSFAFKYRHEKALKILLAHVTNKKLILDITESYVSGWDCKPFKREFYERFLALKPTKAEMKEAGRRLFRIAVLQENEGACNYLLKQGLDPNDVEEGDSYLIWASWKDNINLVRSFLKYGTDVNRVNSNGESALFYAVNWDNLPIARVLLKHGADPHIKNWEGVTPLLKAADCGHAKVFFELFKVDKDLSQRTRDGTTPFLAACKSGNLEIVKALVEAGACLTDVDNRNRNCLHFAVGSKNSSDLLVYLSDKIDFYTMITATDADGNQPLGVLLSDSKKKFVTDLLLALPKLKEIIGVSKRVRIKNTLNSVQQEMCLICRDCYGKDDWTIVLPCQHVFHDACYKEWSKMKKSCPFCRRPTFIIKK